MNRESFKGLHSYKRLFAYLKPYKKYLITAVVCMVLFGASEGIIPVLIRYVLDEVFTSHNAKLLYSLPLILISFALFRAAADFGQQFTMAVVSHNIVKDIRNQLSSKILRLSPSYFLYAGTGNLLSRLTSDVNLVKVLLTDSLVSLIRDSFRVIALVTAALYLDWRLALIGIVAFPAGMMPVYLFGNWVRRYSRKAQGYLGKLSALFAEMIQGIKVIKIFGQENLERERFGAQNQKITRFFIKADLARSLSSPVNEVLASIAISLVLLYGGHSVISGSRTAGQFMAFLASLFLLYDPFKKLGRVYTQLQQGLSGADRLYEVLNAKEEIRKKTGVPRLSENYSIHFKNVTFCYPLSNGEIKKNPPALENITFFIPDGSKTAVVGESGAGKTTLVYLLAGFMEPSEGEILIGGVNLTDVPLQELRSKIAMVDQHTFLFNDTIYNNIAYGKSSPTKEEVIKAAKDAYAYQFIMELPEKFDTLVGEGGFSLSGGQRQRIAIARALLKNAPILLLDEATASLDSQSEKEVQKALDKLLKDRTAIIIAHRLSTVYSADKIIVLKDGKVVETGTHKELLEKGSEYKRLYRLQFIGQEKNTPGENYNLKDVS